MNTEAWQPIPDYDGFYEASSIGRIRSVAREVTALREGKPVTWRLKSRIIKPRMQNGYPTVTLSKDGIHDHWRVHRLMLVAFVGPCPEGMEGLHANDIRTDNRLENLRWGTRSDNMQDALRNGTHPTGSKTHCKRGHEFTPENTGRQSKGGRFCRQCARDYGRERARTKYGWTPRVLAR